jgi:hypothetical protein
MLSIMMQILNEKVTQPLVDVILRNLVKDDKVRYLLSTFLVDGMFLQSLKFPVVWTNTHTYGHLCYSFFSPSI